MQSGKFKYSIELKGIPNATLLSELPLIDNVRVVCLLSGCSLSEDWLFTTTKSEVDALVELWWRSCDANGKKKAQGGGRIMY